MKKWVLGILALIAIVAASGVYYVQTKYLGIGLPWVSSVDIPDIPQLEEPKPALAESDKGTIYFSTKSPYDFSRLLIGFDNLPSHSGMGELFLPDGASAENPVPAIIIVPGSGGSNPDREPEYARIFNELGFAAFVLDYYTPRGTGDEDHYIRKVLSATEADILVDAFSALNLLNTHPSIDAENIGITGYSYGGMVTRYALDPRIKQIVAPDVAPFALHMSFYGPCHQTLGEDATTGGAYLAIFGDSDNSVDPAACARVEKVLIANGASVESHTIEGAGHAWEVSRPLEVVDNPYVRGCDFMYDPKTGVPLVDGAKVAHPAPDATRQERAYNRTAISIETPHCIGEGYLIGSNPKADAKAKAIMTEFLKTSGFVKAESLTMERGV